MDISSKGPVKRVTIEAVIIRANGQREDLGVIADTDDQNSEGVIMWHQQPSS